MTEWIHCGGHWIPPQWSDTFFLHKLGASFGDIMPLNWPPQLLLKSRFYECYTERGNVEIHSVNVCWAKKRKEGKEKVGEEKRLLEFG